MWIADQDFPPAPPIQRVLDEMVAIGDLGYPVRPWLNPLPALFAERQAARHGWKPDPARVRVLTDVLQAMEASLLLHGSPGDGVIVQTPIYPPFLEAVRTTRRELVENRLHRACPRRCRRRASRLRRTPLGDRPRRLPRRGHSGRASSCSATPTIPTGRVFTRAELEAMAEIVVEHDLVVFADEIHQDLLFPGQRHVPFASLGDEVARRTVTFTSATKSWNLAGLCCAVAHYRSRRAARCDRRLSLRTTSAGSRSPASRPPPPPGAMATRGWSSCSPISIAIANGSRRSSANDCRASITCRPRRPSSPGSTAAPSISPAGRSRYFLERARVALSDGPDFGEAGRGFVRLNFATPRAILDQVLERMAAALR